MSITRKLLLSIGGLAFAVLVVGVFLPSRAHVEREIIIAAQRATVYSLLNDFRQINKWSPWLDGDPNARFEVSGAARGVGATITWSGNIIGHGQQTITSSIPFERIESILDAGDGRPATTAFTLTDTDAGTRVVCSYHAVFGMDLAGRYLGLILDSIVGEDFEKGLRSLQTMAESLPRGDFSDIEIEHIVVEGSEIALLPASSVPEAAAIAESLRDAYFDILGFIDEHGLQEVGSPLSISRGFSGSEIRFDAAIPVRGVNNASPRTGPGVRISMTYAGPVIRVQHVGSYRTLAATHDKIAAYLAALGIQRNGDTWESYVSDPTRVDEAEIMTYVYYPVVEQP
jgi:effector-binding domain-containing protein/uncharacterized protein YndB with AHSA1/START domain